MTDTRRRFVLQAIDPATHGVTADADFEVADLSELCALLEADLENFDPRWEYPLEGESFRRIRDRFVPGFEADDCYGTLRQWRCIDGLPYKVHTNRELAMMLAGQKPLAAFVADYPDNAEQETIPEQAFAPYVQSGRFIRREQLCTVGTGTSPKRRVRRVLYSLPGEQWRIDAYLLLHRIAAKAGWSEGFERMEGSLLGYEDWQNDAYVELMYRKP